MDKRRNNELLQGNITNTFFKYLIPSVSATIMISVNYFVDTLCIGRKLGEQGLAALNLSWPITTVLYSLGLLFGAGGGAIFSAYMAKGEKKKARSIYTNSAITLLILAVVIGCLGNIFLEDVVTFLGGTGSIRQGVTDYLRWVLLFSFAYMGECFYGTIVRNDKAPKLSMIATLLGCSLNIVLDLLFVFVFEWGMVGASLATSLAVTTTMMVGLVYSFTKKSNLKFIIGVYRIKEIFYVVKVGFSTFLTEVDVGIVTFIFNMVLLRISGETAIATYGIVLNINTIVLAAINGVSNAMQPLVSANSGAGKLIRVNKFTSLAVKCGVCMSIVFVILLEWRAEWFVRVFIEPDAAFLRDTAWAIRLVAPSYLIASANMILVSYFQSIQAAKQAVSLSLFRSLILPTFFVISCAFFFGIEGVWITALLSEAVLIAIIIGVYRGKNRQRMEENLSQLNFFSEGEPVQSLLSWIEKIDADNLSGYQEVMNYCESKEQARFGIPSIIGLDDLTLTEDVVYDGAKEDKDFSTLQAMAALIFTDLYEQTEIPKASGYSAAAPAMSALAEKFFRCEQDEDGKNLRIVSYEEIFGNYNKKRIKKDRVEGI